jgi:hypothetical protein
LQALLPAEQPPPLPSPPLRRQIDTDGSGTISVAELGESLKAFGIYDSASDLLHSADKNGDGYIDYAEFTFMLREQQAQQEQQEKQGQGRGQGQEVARSRSRRNLFF